MSVHNAILIACAVGSAVLIFAVIWWVPNFRPRALPPSHRHRFWSRLIFAWLLTTALLIAIGIETTNAYARYLMRARLMRATNDRSTVSVDGQRARRPRAILEELAKVRFIAAHHSHPGARHEVRIGSSPEIVVQLAPDSENLHEYWVYWMAVSPDGEIGRLRSSQIGKAMSDVETSKPSTGS